MPVIKASASCGDEDAPDLLVKEMHLAIGHGLLVAGNEGVLPPRYAGRLVILQVDQET